MNNKLVFLTACIAFLVAWCAPGLHAQCTSFAGTVTPQDATLCEGTFGFQAATSTGSVLDANDLKVTVIHTGTATQLGTVLATGNANGLFTSALPAPGVYQVAVLVGSNIPGTVLINLNDPCLSMAYSGTLTIAATPKIQLFINNSLSCAEPSMIINATLIGNFPNFSVEWTGNGLTPMGLNATVTQSGPVSISITDNNTGCVGTTTGYVQSSQPFMQVMQDDPDPCVVNPATQILRCSLPQNVNVATYEWSTGATTANIEIPNTGPAGFAYCVTVTLDNGCVLTDCHVPVLSEGFSFDIEVSTFCDSSEVFLTLGQIYDPQLSYSWSTGSMSPGTLADDAGNYSVTVTHTQGCTTVVSYFLENEDLCTVLTGRVLGDMDSDCGNSAGDVPLSGITLEITDLSDNTVYLVKTQNDGTWSHGLASGNYAVTVLPSSSVWEPCVVSQVINLNGQDTVDMTSFYLKPAELCPRLNVDIATPFLRRCFTSTYYVTYCNTGTQAATGAYVDINLDPFVAYTSSTIPATNLGNFVYRFQVGDVPVGACSTFQVGVTVSCDAVLGQTHCASATIYPNDPCGENLAAWSGASLQLTAECDGDSLRFELKNIGSVAMTSALEYVVIEDAVMMKQVPPPAITLAAGQSIHEAFPANGSTWYMSAVQEPNHPGNSHPAISVEGCTTGNVFSTGFVNMFPQDDGDYWTDIDCIDNIGSFDPNDKQGYPLGYGAEHQIERGTDIEYMIRFQNTGTDTAFTVVIRDTISEFLDPRSIVPGASSHPYHFDFYGEGTNVKFVFDNILLPDSTTNLAGSQGFVTYRIAQKTEVPYGSVIHNSAAIYFDYNEPVVTNTTRHKVDQKFVTVSNWEPGVAGAAITMMPNPMLETAILRINGVETGTEIRVELFDQTGRLQKTGTTNNGQWLLQRGDLPSGLYTVRVSTQQQLIGVGKMQIVR